MWTTAAQPAFKTPIDRTAFIRKLEQQMMEIKEQMQQLEHEIRTRRIQVRFGHPSESSLPTDLIAA